MEQLSIRCLEPNKSHRIFNERVLNSLAEAKEDLKKLKAFYTECSEWEIVKLSSNSLWVAQNPVYNFLFRGTIICSFSELDNAKSYFSRMLKRYKIETIAVQAKDGTDLMDFFLKEIH